MLGAGVRFAMAFATAFGAVCFSSPRHIMIMGHGDCIITLKIYYISLHISIYLVLRSTYINFQSRPTRQVAFFPHVSQTFISSFSSESL
jgi:hypothetical protein